ncbi:HRDC domain-containing protein [Haliscomenobacter sp.]|uniref:HRDC domain-containing protein n=1 Tax=Haliscomenobacter sp. TaxID=2717303 RepID=UPI00359454D4
MDFRIFTLPFDPISEGFSDEIVTQFCLNKKVYSVQSQFFVHEGRPFWSVAVQYETLVKGEEKVRDLDDAQQLLYNRLREWRKKQGEKEGMPVFIIATNQHLVSMVRLKVQSLEGFKQIKGFGQKRVQNYGKAIIGMVKAFYEEQVEKKPDRLEAS